MSRKLGRGVAVVAAGCSRAIRFFFSRQLYGFGPVCLERVCVWGWRVCFFLFACFRWLLSDAMRDGFYFCFRKDWSLLGCYFGFFWGLFVVVACCGFRICCCAPRALCGLPFLVSSCDLLCSLVSSPTSLATFLPRSGRLVRCLLLSGLWWRATR